MYKKLILRSKTIKNIKCLKHTFSRAQRGSFFQVQPQLHNQYNEDAYLKEHLKLIIPTEVRYLRYCCLVSFN